MSYASTLVPDGMYCVLFSTRSFSAILHCPAGSSHASGKFASVCTCSLYASAGTFPHRTLCHLNTGIMLIPLSLFLGMMVTGALHVAGGGGQDCALHVVQLP